MIKVPRPFAPAGNQVTVNVAAGKSPAFKQVRFANTPQVQAARAVRLLNVGPDIAFIELVGEQSDQTALMSSGIPLPPNIPTVLSMQGATFLSATTPTEATIYATPGEGQS